MDSYEIMKKAVDFHGHTCPGIAIGVMAAKWVLENGNEYSIDEELVAIVENDNCSVDAIQALLGTTFGKGNFIFKDYGKNSFTFYNRAGKNAVRLSLNQDLFGNSELSREEKTDFLLKSNPEDIFNIEKVKIDEPPLAGRFASIICDSCGELTMETRVHEYVGKKYCIPCYELIEK